MARTPVTLPPVPTGPDRPVILVRVYPGHHEEAAQLLAADADALTANGYTLVGQSYAVGRYSQATVLVAAILVLVGIGVILLAFMAAVRPPGTLAATYELRDAATAVAR